MRLGRPSVWQRAAAWLAAYAFVLQTALAPIAASAQARQAAIEAAAVTDCVAHLEQVGNGGEPLGSQHDHDAACKRCIGYVTAAVATPDHPAVLVEFAALTIHWTATGSVVADRDWLDSHRARGPPAMT
jgi:hypothetical protein